MGVCAATFATGCGRMSIFYFLCGVFYVVDFFCVGVWIRIGELIVEFNVNQFLNDYVLFSKLLMMRKSFVNDMNDVLLMFVLKIWTFYYLFLHPFPFMIFEVSMVRLGFFHI